jgi:metal-responsive CopG/Arc/MetJ family transcriptional regulator
METHSVRCSIYLKPSMVRQLDAWAEAHRWTRSRAVEVLIERGLPEDTDETQTAAQGA